jgi:hypothetical protein
MNVKKLGLAISLQAFALAGCYIVPTGVDGNYAIYIPSHPGTLPPGAASAGQAAQPAMPRVLHARLYPDNEVATQTGMVSGTVTNMMTGKGRFQLSYAGELLTGEATRVSGDERKGIASAYGASGAFMSCEYQMHTPMQGAGTCMFSNGAKYKVHIGN